MAAPKAAVQFRYSPGTPLNQRIKWIAGLLLAGAAIEFVLSVFLGWLVFLVGCMLGAIKSKDMEPDIPEDGEWKATTIEELQDIPKLSDQVAAWQSKMDKFRGGSTTGCALTAGAFMALVVAGLMIAGMVDQAGSSPRPLFATPLSGGPVLPIWILDGLTLMIPIWFAGGISAWQPEYLTRKACYLLSVHEASKSEPILEFIPSLLVSSKDDVTVPRDCRMLIRIKNAPQDFIGIQVQISLNEVQGSSYPYCYAVVIAKKEFGLTQKVGRLLEPPEQMGLLKAMATSENDKKEMAFHQYDGAIAEVTSEPDADVVVVRQITVGEGYHTNEDQALKIVSKAISLTCKILGR